MTILFTLFYLHYITEHKLQTDYLRRFSYITFTVYHCQLFSFVFNITKQCYEEKDNILQNTDLTI